MEPGDRGATSPAPDAMAEVPLDRIPLHSTTLLTVLDPDGTIRYESPSISNVFGYDQEELVGTNVAAYFHPADRERVLEAFRSVVEAEDDREASVEYRHARADGSYRWVESVASANPMPDGSYVVNTRDIAEQKERERLLERSNERLEEFARVVSHDLRNPLNVATSRLDLAREQVESEHLDEVARAHGRMEELIEDVLTLARGGAELERAWVDLAALARASWQTVADDTAGATLAVDADRSIHADRSRVRQLLENLLRNAIDHGGPDVTVTIGALDADGFFVADDGTGIPERHHERVFEDGFSTVSGGTGIGLGIVAEVAASHGWDVTLTASEAGGARFAFRDVDLR